MIGVDKALLRLLLWIEGPWEITDYQLDLRRRRCDVWVGPQVERGWFGRPKSKATAPTQPHVWQHLALGEIRFHLHVALPEGTPTQGVHWMGTPGQPFTAALAQQVFMFFNEGMSLQSICSTLKLSLSDVWRYRFALDHGKAQVLGSTAEPGGSSVHAAQRAKVAAEAVAQSAAFAPAERSDTIPDVADPVWLRLASGDLQLDIRVLSLKLMLTRMRSQLDLISDDEVKLLKLRDLHRYFVKNERVLTHELAQLRTA